MVYFGDTDKTDALQCGLRLIFYIVAGENIENVPLVTLTTLKALCDS
jgi:hypothetical protein